MYPKLINMLKMIKLLLNKKSKIMNKLKFLSWFALIVFSATAWADSQYFTYFNQGNITQSPVTVDCGAVYHEYALLNMVVKI